MLIPRGIAEVLSSSLLHFLVTNLTKSAITVPQYSMVETLTKCLIVASVLNIIHADLRDAEVDFISNCPVHDSKATKE